MRVKIIEEVRTSFEVEIEDGLEGAELEAAVEEARVQYTGEVQEDVTDSHWHRVA